MAECSSTIAPLQQATLQLSIPKEKTPTLDRDPPERVSMYPSRPPPCMLCSNLATSTPGSRMYTPSRDNATKPCTHARTCHAERTCPSLDNVTRPCTYARTCHAKCTTPAATMLPSPAHTHVHVMPNVHPQPRQYYQALHTRTYTSC